jgi:hypothetical protein
MAGCDYSGFAINFKTEAWTNMGYIRDGKGTVGFHKYPDVKMNVLVEPSGEAFSQSPGIARYGDWWVVFGYTDVCPMQFLLDYLRANNENRACAIFNRIIKKKRTL